MNKTEHAITRLSQRGIKDAACSAAIEYGRKVHRTGKIFYVLLTKDVKGTEYIRYAGTVVVMSSDGYIITAYRNQSGFKNVLKKEKRRL